jgi:hypothetical protein
LSVVGVGDRVDRAAKSENKSGGGGRSVGITLILALVVVALALGGGLVVGRRRGPVAGIATGLGVLAAGLVGYVGLVASASSM